MIYYHLQLMVKWIDKIIYGIWERYLNVLINNKNKLILKLIFKN